MWKNRATIVLPSCYSYATTLLCTSGPHLFGTGAVRTGLKANRAGTERPPCYLAPTRKTPCGPAQNTLRLSTKQKHLNFSSLWLQQDGSRMVARFFRIVLQIIRRLSIYCGQLQHLQHDFSCFSVEKKGMQSTARIIPFFFASFFIIMWRNRNIFCTFAVAQCLRPCRSDDGTPDRKGRKDALQDIVGINKELVFSCRMTFEV